MYIRFSHSLKALFSDFFILYAGYFLCKKVPFWSGIFSSSFYSILSPALFCIALCALSIFLYDLLVLKQNYNSTSFEGLRFAARAMKHLYNGRPMVSDIKESYPFFLLLIKLFFVPLMLQFSILNFESLRSSIPQLLQNPHAEKGWIYAFNHDYYPILLSLCFFIDTIFYLFGYLIYSPILGNTIRSVETTFLGWASALLCYPPFFMITQNFLPSRHSDYPFWLNENLTFALRCSMLLLLIIYTLATINLGWKCSNLTNRGIVSHGVYSIVRHPAYIAKNLFWWISLIPVVYIFPQSIFFLLGINLLYLIRALTEERHLKKDPDYQAYCKKVPYRFIPYVV